MFTLAEAGWLGINFHVGGGNHYSPIVQTSSGAFEPKPLYYAMLLFAYAGQGSLIPIHNRGTSLRAFAIRGARDERRVVLVNSGDIICSSNQLAVQRIHGSNLYTGTPAAALHRAEILLYTTFHLNKRYPNLAQFCALQGVAAIADMGAKAIYRGKYRRMAFEFLGGFPLRRRIGLISRAGISHLRNRLRRLRLKRFGVSLK